MSNSYYCAAYFSNYWKGIVSVYTEIRNKERESVLSTLSDEQRKALGL